MRSILFSTLLLLPAASFALADPIAFNQGTIYSFYDIGSQTGEYGYLEYLLNSPNLTIQLWYGSATGSLPTPPNSIPVCAPYNAGTNGPGTCTWTLSYSGTPPKNDLGPPFVSYNGTQYTWPDSFAFGITMTASPVTAPSTLTTVNGFETLMSSFANVPFSMTGTLSIFDSANTPIITGLAFSGSGIVSGSTNTTFGNCNECPETTGSLTYTFTPEPSSVGLMATGLAGLAFAIRRRRV